MRSLPRRALVRRAFCLVASIPILAIAPVLAATLEVDDDGGTPYLTIQGAIDAAIPGADDVFVHCGVYAENIVLREQIDVTGAGAHCTIIDGGQNGTVVTIDGLGAGNVLEGFTIRNGRSGLGGGIYVEGSSPWISKNVIVGNSAIIDGALTGYGGGIHITANVGTRADTAPVVTGNIIRGNSAEKFGGGIEIYMDDGTWLMNNLIEENTAAEGGGGVDSFISFPTIVNNTIVRNCLQGGETACSGGGGGISLTDSAVVEMANNVVAWNEAATGGGGVDFVNSTINFVSNDAWGNSPENYYPTRDDPTGSDGNVSTDPRFVCEQASSKSYQPRSDSPLVDGGADALSPSLDLRGVARPLDGDVNGGAMPDIGARENEGVTRLRFVSATVVVWDPSVSATAVFNLYRGDRQALIDTEIYTQDPATVPGASQWCGLSAPTIEDVDQPGPGQAYFYLAVVKDVAEGTLGFWEHQSVFGEREFTDPNRCD